MFAACDSFTARFLLFRAGWVGYLHSKTLVVFVDCYLPPPILLNIYKHKKFDIHILLLAPPFSVFFMIDHLCNFPHLSPLSSLSPDPLDIIISQASPRAHPHRRNNNTDNHTSPTSRQRSPENYTNRWHEPSHPHDHDMWQFQ